MSSSLQTDVHGDADVWVFGYGSLIWKPEFDYLERRQVRAHGWTRRFWQGSHDHRGMPDAPGRVATLIESPAEFCDGMAFRISADQAKQIFLYLDHREKNGFERRIVSLMPLEGDAFDALVYIATPDNEAFLGEASTAAIAQHIKTSHGPSGSNEEYLLRLAQALREMNAHDAHVFELEVLVLA
jgi:glutathione-specific gamma-glutamylcyclotransferase